jgi:hypothetical protein
MFMTFSFLVIKPMLNEFLTNASPPSMHKGTKSALLTCIASVFDGRHLTIADVGRGIDSDAKRNAVSNAWID